MSASEDCPNCKNIYGNEPRKIPCGHIVCHKCCLELFNRENNTLECPSCSEVHTFKSKNIFKKSLQQVAHAGFGKKTSGRDVSFALSMPVEKASAAEKSANKEVKKAAANLPTAPPGAPPDISTAVPPPPPPTPIPPAPVSVAESVPKPPPLMPFKPNVNGTTSKVSKQKQTTPPSSLFDRIVSPAPARPTTPVPSSSDAVIARCHSCQNKCQVIVCEHCDHFVCLKCAEDHRKTTNVDVNQLTNKWQECKNKYEKLLVKLNQHNRGKTQIEKDLSAIRVAVEQRARDAIQFVTDQRESLIERVNQHIENEKNVIGCKHDDIANEFRRIQTRFDSALNGEDIGSYTQDDFLRDIRELQTKLNKRDNIIETHILKIPTISRYERVPIEKLLGELRLNSNVINVIPNITVFPSFRPNGNSEYLSSPKIPPSTNESTNIKPLMGDAVLNGTNDAFEEFRRMAAQIHQQFNAPYSKVINSTPSHDGISNPKVNDKNSKLNLPNTFTKSWKVEHTAVPNFLCMTPFPQPKAFVVDKHGKVSVCNIPPKSKKPFESYTLFPNGNDEIVESVAASTYFLIVYSRKKQDTMTGRIYFFNHECKLVLPNGIHQNIPVHHIVCDQNANRLYCLDRMRCTIYYHTLPNNVNEIETCMKTRRDFVQFDSHYSAAKILQNDDLLGFYERNECVVHLYDKKTNENILNLKCDHFNDKFESWGIIAIRKDNTNLIFKIDERGEHDAVTRQHIVYELNSSTNQIINKIQLNAVFGMIIGPNNEIILGIRQTKESGLIQCFTRK